MLSGRTGSGLHTNSRVTSWWHNRVADILGIRITVSGPRPKAPALLVSNHVSWLDIVVLGGLTHTDFLSKYEVRQWPVIGWLAARSGTLFIRRGNHEAAAVSEQIGQRLRHQGIFTLFPEGRTTDGREVRPFFSRLFAAAIDTGTDVIPVTLRYHIDGGYDPIAPYTDNQSITQNLRGLITRDHTEVNVVFGQPIPFDGHTRKEIAALARDAILAALQGPEQIPLRNASRVARVGRSDRSRCMQNKHMSDSNVDTLILGQGLAGSLLAWMLIRKGQKVCVIDDAHRSSSSRVAAGLVNPLAGMRFNRRPEMDDWLRASRPLLCRTGRAIRQAVFPSTADAASVQVLPTATLPCAPAARSGQPGAAGRGLRSRGLPGANQCARGWLHPAANRLCRPAVAARRLTQPGCRNPVPCARWTSPTNRSTWLAAG